MHKLILIATIALTTGPIQAEPVRIDGGHFTQPVLLDNEQRTVRIDGFRLDATQVSNADFLAFLRQAPEWRRDQAPSLFRDNRYLAHWPAPDALGEGDAAPDRPVTRVSWYAARAYCEARGGRLPTLDEWEYASARQREISGQSDEAYAAELFDWYTNPGSGRLAPVGSGPDRGLGIHDLHGLVLEWVEDFQLLVGSGENVDLLAGSCGDTARLMPEFDPAHYATFLRYQSRSNYTAATTTSTLGFRCAYDGETQK